VDLIDWTYFYRIRQIGIKDRSLIDKINLTLIALTASAMQHCLLAWKLGEFTVRPEFGPTSETQCQCDTRNIHHAVNDAWTDIFRCLNMDFLSFWPEVQANKIHTIRSMIHRRIHSTGMHPAMAQPHDDLGSFAEDCLDCVLEELIEQPNYSFDHPSSFVAATEARM